MRRVKQSDKQASTSFIFIPRGAWLGEACCSPRNSPPALLGDLARKRVPMSGRCPTAIKLRNSRSRSQAPAWERPCLGGSSLPFLSGALCFWRSGRRLEPPGILHSQAGAWERARVTRASKLNLTAVGRCPRLTVLPCLTYFVACRVACLNRHGAFEDRASVLDCGSPLFPLPTNRKPSTEAGSALIICHPELAKDLTTRQPALCHDSPFSKLTAPPDEPSVPNGAKLRNLSVGTGDTKKLRSVRSPDALNSILFWVFSEVLISELRLSADKAD